MNQILAVNIGDLPLGSGHTLSGTYPRVSVLVSLLLNNAITIIGIILLALLILGGITYIIGAGNDDPKAMQKAQSIIVDAAIGFAVVFLSYFIIQVVEIVTGVKILNPGF